MQLKIQKLYNKDQTPNALKVGQTYQLNWQGMDNTHRQWVSNEENTIHINSNGKGHSNLTFIHPSSNIGHLNGCKSICKKENLYINEGGEVQVKSNNAGSPFNQSITDIISINELYNKYNVKRFQLKYVSNIDDILNLIKGPMVIPSKGLSLPSIWSTTPK